MSERNRKKQAKTTKENDRDTKMKRKSDVSKQYAETQIRNLQRVQLRNVEEGTLYPSLR
jgi:hypothetical protein